MAKHVGLHTAWSSWSILQVRERGTELSAQHGGALVIDSERDERLFHLTKEAALADVFA